MTKYKVNEMEFIGSLHSVRVGKDRTKQKEIVAVSVIVGLYVLSWIAPVFTN